MKLDFIDSLGFRLGVAIMVVEFVALTLLGGLYTRRFSAQVDQQLRRNILKPGRLISDGVLKPDAVAQAVIMERLVGSGVVEAMVVGANGNIFHSLDERQTGESITNLAWFNPFWLTQADDEPLLMETQERENSYLVAVSPVTVGAGKTPFLFSCLKLRTTEAAKEKAQLGTLFTLGSLATIIATTAALLACFRWLVARRLSHAAEVVAQVAAGDLSARSQEIHSPDEVGLLLKGVNTMADRLQQTILSLEQSVADLQKSETARRQGEENFRRLFEAAPVPLVLTRRADSTLMMANVAAARFFETNPGAFSGMPVNRFYHQEADRQRLLQIVAEHGRVDGLEVGLVSLTGRRIWGSISAYPIEYLGEPALLVGVTDLTERRKAEQALQDKTEELDRFFNVALDLLCIADNQGCFHRLNPQWEAGLGYSLAELEGSRFFDFVHPDDVEATLAALGELKNQKAVLNFVNRYRHKDGSYRWIEWRSNPAGDLIYTAARDITERKQVEEALLESKERFSVFMSHLPAAAFIKDAEGRTLYINRYLQDLLGFRDWEGKSTPELVSGSMGVKMAEDDTKALSTGFLQLQETMVDACGNTRTFETLKFPIRIEGKPVLLGGISVDITDLKRAEEVLRLSLGEKVALLKEVHHRVKNNLQIVTSLLNLQAGSEKNSIVLEALRTTQTRIRSMALLHEMLYRSENMAQIDAVSYLENLCAQLFRSIGRDSVRLKLECRAAAIELGLDQAVPCGLIINELVSNSLKYAFPDGRPGRILVEMHSDTRQHIVLTVADDGVGLPDGFEITRTMTLGHHLVRILVSQLNGSLEVKQGPGAVFQIHFPAKPQ